MQEQPPHSVTFQNIALKVVDALGELDSIDLIRKNLNILSKPSVNQAQLLPSLFPNGIPESSLYDSFCQCLLRRIKECFPRMLREGYEESTVREILGRELEENENLLKQLSCLMRLHHKLSEEINSVVQQATFLKSGKGGKGTGAKRGIKKAPKRKNLEEGMPQMKTHTFVRLQPRGNDINTTMMKYKNFPRLQLKIETKLLVKNLVGYLENRWLRQTPQNKIVLYPDPELFLKKLNGGKAELEPLHEYYLMSDLLCAYDWPKLNQIVLYYDIVGAQSEPASEPVRKHDQPSINISPPVQAEKGNPYLQASRSASKQRPLFLAAPNFYKQTICQNSSLLANNPFQIYNSIGVDSINMNSVFKRNYHNSNSVLFGNGHFSNNNSFGMGWPTRQNEQSSHTHMDVIRQAINQVEKQHVDQQSNGFKESASSPPRTVVPIIKRKPAS